MQRPCRELGRILLALGLVVLTFELAVAAGAKPADKPQPLKKLSVHLVDADHKPVSGADVGTFADFTQRHMKSAMTDSTGLLYVSHCVSGKDGVAQLVADRGDLADYRGRVRIVARHVGRGLIAFADLDAAHGPPVAELTLVPECRISGKIVCPELAKLGRKVDWTNVYLNLGQARLMASDSERGDFHLVVPPGRYELNGYGTYLASKHETLTVPADKREMELTLTLPPKKFALLMGHPAPELRDIAAWKNGPPLKLADLKGKCVALEFWGYWCGPCVYRMPHTFELYDRFGKQGLVVIGIHVDFTPAKVDTVAKLDEKLVETRKDLWHGRDLPFPVAIARPLKEGAAVAVDYGINSYPTMLLIDRSGNVVDIVYESPVGVALLQKTLAEKPTGQTADGKASPAIVTSSASPAAATAKPQNAKTR
jgi:thiol-disulfide isomerase/thioredoxin